MQKYQKFNYFPSKTHKTYYFDLKKRNLKVSTQISNGFSYLKNARCHPSFKGFFKVLGHELFRVLGFKQYLEKELFIF